MKRFLKKGLAGAVTLSCLVGAGFANSSIVSAKERGKVVFTGFLNDGRNELIKAITQNERVEIEKELAVDSTVIDYKDQYEKEVKITMTDTISQDQKKFKILSANCLRHADAVVLTYDITAMANNVQKVVDKYVSIRNDVGDNVEIFVVGIGDDTVNSVGTIANLALQQNIQLDELHLFSANPETGDNIARILYLLSNVISSAPDNGEVYLGSNSNVRKNSSCC